MRLFRFVIVLASTALLLAACSSTTTSSSPSGSGASAGEGVPVYEVTASRLNVREAPNSSGAVAGFLTQGERVDAPYDAIDGWLYVKSESGQSGYVSQKYLRRVEAAAPQSAPAAPAAAAKAQYEPVTEGKLSQISEGMSNGDVVSILGSPTSEQSYTTGKQWIPYYYGSDTSRVDYKYAGLGVVTFSRNRYSGNLKVVSVVSDLSEDGY